MPVPSYAWVYEGPFHDVFLITTTVLSVISNGLLLGILFTKASSTIGSYRYLLGVFAVCDLITSFAHALIIPTVHLTSVGVYFFSRRSSLIIGGRSYDSLCCLVFIAAFFQTFLVLAYHYIYRLHTVVSSLVNSCSCSWSNARWTIAGVIVNIVYIAIVFLTTGIAFTPTNATRLLAPSEIHELYSIDLRNQSKGFAAIAMMQPDPVSGSLVWHPPSVIGMIILVALAWSTAGVVLYCIWKINSVLRSSEFRISSKTQNLQKDLFVALLVQTAVPVLFSYIPMGSILVLPVITGTFSNLLFQ